MAWGLEARVPFLDKQFLEVTMNIDPGEKTFSKGAEQEIDQDGRPKMEKVYGLRQKNKLRFIYSSLFLVHPEESL